MDTIGLINPSSKQRNYQNLSSLSAVMPPHWLAVRATYHKAFGRDVKVVDCAVEEFDPGVFAHCRAIEIMPSGVHPHAFIHEQAGVESVMEQLEPLGKPIEVITKLTFDALQYPPDWTLFDLHHYTTHNWHAWGMPSRTPYGTLTTSISCPNNCKFCNIDNYYNSGYKRQPMEKVETDLLALYGRGVRNIKMMDELFVTTEQRMYEFCAMIQRNKFHDLNIWGYARLDGLLRLKNINGWMRTFSDMKTAGINWICIGIESGNRDIRKQYGKGDATNMEITKLIGCMQRAGLSILGNFMFGFPEDDATTMHETFNFAVELNCEYSNFYCMVPYPGTGMETYAKAQGWEFPPNYSAYSQYAYDFQPLPTHHVNASTVLKSRDMYWLQYHKSNHYLSAMETKFGSSIRTEIESMTEHTLKRKLFNE